ncbi:hypothetical protein [Nitrosovibrio tenuis]|uniref:Uncharacterized protein n=1 Tax=Nitrosovibrio tenuis TaxID=1233 RepID=A0A1H7FJN6_9PROT|nr:hypothetical protein [Nitrosovibrio tenuis]SEK26199.1 hypothetical protein SAMN05216387_1017 [Nitrosovibrio tenuis]
MQTTFCTLHRQQYRANDIGHHTSDQVTPFCLPTRQIRVIPLIKRTDRPRLKKCNGQPVSPAQSASQTNTQSGQGKSGFMSEFVRRSGQQIHSNRLSPQHKQAKNYRQRQQLGLCVAKTK